MKKRLWFYTALFLITGMGTLGYEYYLANQIPSLESLWKSERTLPKELDMRSYLSGNIARQKGQSDLALDAYLKVLKKDPQNKSLMKDTYVLAMVQGRAKDFLPYLDNFISQSTPSMMTDYLQATHLFQQGKTEQALKQFKSKQKHKIDSLLIPLLSSWIYVQQGNRAQAFKVLEQLSNKNTFTFAKGYQTFLLGSYYNDEKIIQEGLQQIQGKRLPAIGFFPLIKKHVSKEADILQQYEKMQKNYPATAELIHLMGQENLTIETGMAEIFYLVSADEGNNLLTKEEALFINSIALLLDPNKTLAWIWGSELTNALNLNQLSLIYFDKIPQENATLLFKKAQVLAANNRSEEALELLQKLRKTNQENVPLLSLMAQIYTEKNQQKEALKIYDFILNQLSSKMETKTLAKTHLMRANVNYTLNNMDALVLDLEKAYILLPEDPMIQNDLGYNKLLQGQIEEGFQLIQKAYQKNPENPYILDSMAFAYIQKQQFSTALPFAEKAMEVMPQSALINMRLGDIYQALGRKREAKFQYKKALDLKTDLPSDLEKKIRENLKHP